MNAAERRRLQANYEKLVGDVKYYHVSPHLLSTFILDQRTHELIRTEKTEFEQMERLLEVLPSRGEKAMKEFVAALRKGYPWLADALEDESPDTEEVARDGTASTVRQRSTEISISEYIPEVRRALEGSPTACKNWKIIARSMRLRHSSVVDIHENNRSSTSNALMDLLQYWVDEGGPKATFLNLIKILKQERMEFAAVEVHKVWSDVVNPSACSLT